MTLPMARDLSRHAIRVVTIAPGVFDSAMTANFPIKTRRSLENEGVYIPNIFHFDWFRALNGLAYRYCVPEEVWPAIRVCEDCQVDLGYAVCEWGDDQVEWGWEAPWEAVGWLGAGERISCAYLVDSWQIDGFTAPRRWHLLEWLRTSCEREERQ